MGIWFTSYTLQIQTLLQQVILCMNIFMLLKEYLQGNLEVRFLSQTVSAYVLSLDIIKFLSRRGITILFLVSNVEVSVSPEPWQQNVLSCYLTLPV